MSEIADSPVTPVPAPAVVSTPPVHTVHEAYSFACMKCGYSWEQGYEIEHHVDINGQPFIMYTVGGERVPSPLSNPTCMNCGGHVVRIMREGQVSAVRSTLDSIYHHPVAPGIAGPVPAGVDVPRTPKPRRRPRREAPGPVAVSADADGRAGRRGLLARLRSMFRS
ncbi:hypothetical protein M444_14795 [Streptomyces sp. Mg1]|nr:hypothetical protein M444_14795 [Streptomyces sp. Mg1]MBP0934678.1 hypothetical protein [Streptomyces sp. KCTC 0041BP]RPK50552.1 hypothetical protein EES37_05460 [Streptomyces sp. ADI91-18]GHD78804.1 hypothetical protein GCM10010336_59940 [Streptomyces goshikiensis]